MRLGFVILSVLFPLCGSAADLGTGAGSLKTPNISVNTLFLYQNSSFHKENRDPANVDGSPNGFNIQEAELQFYADVDPYTRLSVLLSVHPSFESDGTTIEEKWLLEPEEIFAESLALPSATLKAGKFKAFMGKHNLLHTHVFPFVKAPLVHENLLGDEGLNDLGVSVAVLLPGLWFNELTLQVLRGKGENEEFNSPSPADAVGLVHWKNLIDLSEELTVEVGASYAEGANSLAGTTQLSGADLTFKWRPSVGGRYQAFLWSSEYLSKVEAQKNAMDGRSSGFSSFLQYQFAERWHGLYRYDNLNLTEVSERHSVAFLYTPSEFSSFKLEYDHRHGGLTGPNGESAERVVFLQANFMIGAHPSHSY